MAANDDDDDKRVTRQITARLDVKLLKRIDEFIEAQVVPPNVTAVMEAALKAFLDKHFPEPDIMERETVQELREQIRSEKAAVKPAMKPKPATARRRS